MKTKWIPTNVYYRELAAEADPVARQQRYIECFVQPWQAMLDNFASMSGEPGDASRADSFGRGYTGGVDWTAPRFVAQFFEANDYTIPRLPGAAVHELHHLIRLRVFPWDMAVTTVADYIVHEGLAESYAAALFGEDVVGYYVTDIAEAELATARELIRDGLAKTGFGQIRNYIFGDRVIQGDLGMPDYGGYAVGYHVVQAYLQRTGSSIVDATFVSAQEIVRASGYFA